MASLHKTIINTRADLDAIDGTPEHAEFMTFLKELYNAQARRSCAT